MGGFSPLIDGSALICAGGVLPKSLFLQAGAQSSQGFPEPSNGLESDAEPRTGVRTPSESKHFCKYDGLVSDEPLG